MWDPRDLLLLLGRYVPTGLFASIQGVHIRKEAIVFGDPLILEMCVFHVNLDQLENGATP